MIHVDQTLLIAFNEGHCYHNDSLQFFSPAESTNLAFCLLLFAPLPSVCFFLPFIFSFPYSLIHLCLPGGSLTSRAPAPRPSTNLNANSIHSRQAPTLLSDSCLCYAESFGPKTFSLPLTTVLGQSSPSVTCKRREPEFREPKAYDPPRSQVLT